MFLPRRAVGIEEQLPPDITHANRSSTVNFRHVHSAAENNIDVSQKVYALLGEEMRLLQQESVRVILLNAKFRLIGIEEVSKGTLNSAMAHRRLASKKKSGRSFGGGTANDL